jgi:hypothetical protein
VDSDQPDEWRESFTCITYRDPQAIGDPSYKARGRKVHGPFASYGEAVMYGTAQDCTHFEVEKCYVRPNIHPPFLTRHGDRAQVEIPFTTE